MSLSLSLETKKVTKENSRLQIILGLLFFSLPTVYLFISFAPPKEMNQRKRGRK
jgi:hypothetical protein